MAINDALNYFKNLESKTTKKSEIKVYKNFIQILTSLQNRDLSDAEVQSIELELDALDLNSSSSEGKKYFSKAFKQFQKYLKDTFSLTTEGYYTNLGVAFGSSFGIFFSVIFFSSSERSMGISMGIGLGMIAGLIIGRNLDAKAKAAGRMI